jgi:hypothetical protein
LAGSARTVNSVFLIVFLFTGDDIGLSFFTSPSSNSSSGSSTNEIAAGCVAWTGGMAAVDGVPNIGVVVSVELFTLLGGLTGVTVRMAEDGADERNPETL